MHTRSTRSAAVLLGALALGATSVQAQSGSATVDTRTSLYLAGGNAYTATPPGGPTGGGIAPTAIALDAGAGRVLRVDASGTSFFCDGNTCGTASPDGPSIGATDLNSSGSIAGLTAPTSGFLAAVFLGPSLPGSAPARLSFAGTDFASAAPQLGQIFFVGNGFTSGGVQQQFLVPDAATRLYFGIADGGSFFGDPGFYNDNVGTFTARYDVAAGSVVPEPSTYVLLGSGLVALAGVARRRRPTA
ncbi:PEP-CTERM sorting domain-containing protein [Roseisolibacter sp. H3M3-2]|uniref:PEP-CTERM sorting domain-containing protein n=1 Tax=Roseisolibacter sp. H3M3-2 TaxID=3031323 RepID=UPI0023DA2715|nr:PEP-CTERM sorting domain-containing protein [Roseisolibacter sp. H3M3-2]MDF1504385.1 PEP-CTERM sorting domain-containing protein [Roseisolibacter sp. H3M3-2]